MLKRLTKYVNLYTIANAVFAFIIVRGIYTSIFMNSVNRSFWLDEYWLAESFSTRSFANLFLDGQFAHLQSAPLLWLYFEKTLTLLFGNTEYVLRIGSIIGFTGSIAALIFILAYFYKSKIPLAAAALLANIPFFLQYSNVFKPYIFDGFVSLLILAAYGLWINQKLDTRWLALIWAILIWSAQPACFVIGGCISSEFLFSLAHKNRQELRKTLLLCVVIAVSFVIYYFIWVQRMTDVSMMRSIGYWQGKFFILFPSSISELIQAKNFIINIFSQFDRASLFIMSCTGAGVLYSIWKRDKVLIAALLGILVALFASSLRMYPIQDRMWGFSYPIFIFVTFATIEGIVQREKALLCSLALFLIIYIAGQNGYKHYSIASHVYWPVYEVNLEMDYLAKHMKPEDPIYVEEWTVPGFKYRNGYENRSFGGGTNNVIFGTTLFLEQDKCQKEIEEVINYPKIWIVSTDSKRMRFLIQAMHDKGYLELVSFIYDTPLWWYCQSLDDTKKHFSMAVTDVKNDGDFKQAVITITNDGEAYLNNRYDEIYLINNEDEKIYKINQLVAPKQSISVTVRYKASETPVYQLRSQYGKIAKDDTITLNEVSSSEKEAQ